MRVSRRGGWDTQQDRQGGVLLVRSCAALLLSLSPFPLLHHVAAVYMLLLHTDPHAQRAEYDSLCVHVTHSISSLVLSLCGTSVNPFHSILSYISYDSSFLLFFSSSTPFCFYVRRALSLKKMLRRRAQDKVLCSSFKHCRWGKRWGVTQGHKNREADGVKERDSPLFTPASGLAPSIYVRPSLTLPPTSVCFPTHTHSLVPLPPRLFYMP